jgi:hypothetical protein
LIDQLMSGSPKDRQSLPNLNDFARFLLRQDLRNLGPIRDKLWNLLAPSPAPQIELVIDGIEPGSLSNWAADQVVRVGFTVRNNSGQLTS